MEFFLVALSAAAEDPGWRPLCHGFRKNACPLICRDGAAADGRFGGAKRSQRRHEPRQGIGSFDQLQLDTAIRERRPLIDSVAMAGHDAAVAARELGRIGVDWHAGSRVSQRGLGETASRRIRQGRAGAPDVDEPSLRISELFNVLRVEGFR